MNANLNSLWAHFIVLAWRDTCASCRRPGVQAAHLLGKGAYPRFAAMGWNGMGLCPRCHDEYDGRAGYDKQKRMQAKLRAKYPWWFEQCDKAKAARYAPLTDYARAAIAGELREKIAILRRPTCGPA